MTIRNDAGAAVAFRPLDLEAIDRTLYEPKYEELTARSVLGLKTDVDPGAETYSYDVMTRAGVAKILANNADDIPLVDIDMRREFIRIYSIVTSFQYTVQEQRAANMTNRPVDATKAGVARRAVAEKENRLAWVGDSDYNIKGLTNATGIQVMNVPAGADGTTWDKKTGEEILEDVRQVRALITVLPGHGDSPNLIMGVPPEQYEILAKRYSDYDPRTILDVIKSRNWFKEIKRIADLRNVGTSSADSLLIYDSAPEVVQLLLPMDMYRHEPEWKFPRWKFAVEERCGGCIIRYPMAIARGDGI